ncbi:hypothetical protein LEP1GSC065_0445 [Leptospira kirschneri serovar Sokoine str. RM1]|uniref:Uncharacterized protein n=1 Tax=Leptospira kirschneri serovar Bulgarica str. Nikolaevo TaxID=1240687 RepID=M6FJG6_9LEPT|nr:hypothetical protein LEP1GSC166_2380 [Leptospira kirschneri]EMK22931.1 hypothetical protein LEP1GSC008_3177 [Leptospira kirschneri serovar Bulgarica str. Nikolaevo]EMN23990.1 hypothetical protein LEP1GSC065_0445 [Leptospira kirschneri serovar Sokoine str. RM1]
MEEILFRFYSSSHKFQSLTVNSRFVRVPTDSVALQILKHLFFMERSSFYKTNLLRPAHILLCSSTISKIS